MSFTSSHLINLSFVNFSILGLAMAPLTGVFCTALLFFMVTVAQNIQHSDCSCYLTNGSSASYFTSHRFYDYRNVDTGSVMTPPVIADAAGTSKATFTSTYLASDTLALDWQIQNWNNSHSLSKDTGEDRILMINSLNNVYIGRSRLV